MATEGEYLTREALLDAIDHVRDFSYRPVPHLIPQTSGLPDKMFREVGLLGDAEVRSMALRVLSLASGGPIHPKQACALRVAYARSGAQTESVGDRDLLRWVYDDHYLPGKANRNLM